MNDLINKLIFLKFEKLSGKTLDVYKKEYLFKEYRIYIWDYNSKVQICIIDIENRNGATENIIITDLINLLNHEFRFVLRKCKINKLLDGDN